MTVFLGYGGVPLNQLNFPEEVEVSAGVVFGVFDEYTGILSNDVPESPQIVIDDIMTEQPQGVLDE